MIECGPVAGLIGTSFLGGLIDQPDVTAVDMGGTTSKDGVLHDTLDATDRPASGRNLDMALRSIAANECPSN